jgi:protein SCO1/2
MLALLYFSQLLLPLVPKRTSFPRVHFKTQDGLDFALQSPASKYTIVGFFFTACPTICPKMIRQMKRVQAVISASSKYSILFYSINPKGDTPGKLLSFARQHNIDSRYWLLLTGSERDLRMVSSFYALRGEADRNDSGSFIHDGQFLLTDNQSGVTTRYLGTDSTSVNQLIRVLRSDL